MEGPSLVILREQLAPFVEQRIVAVEGNATFGRERLLNCKLCNVRTYGKHLLLEFGAFYLRGHFLMFGSYRINEKKDQPPRLALRFAKAGEVNFYSCAISLLEGTPDKQYDWRVDPFAPVWDKRLVLRKLRAASAAGGN